MIDEAIGKILGMAMAYGASALGMFVAYVNYRKRIVKADKSHDTGRVGGHPFVGCGGWRCSADRGSNRGRARGPRG